MSLLPKIPCRKLFCDSRFAEGTASEFTVEIPEGGLDLGDNTVAFVDQISVPSIQNVVDGRNTIYYEEQTATETRLLSFELEPKQYSQADLVAETQNALSSKPYRTLTST